jgi:integrase
MSSLSEYLCERNAVTHNTVKGVRRPPMESDEDKTPAIGDDQASELLDAPKAGSLRGERDRAPLAVLLYHALRHDELCRLRVKDARQERRGVVHLTVSGKGGKTRYVPLHPAAGGCVAEYLEAAGHGGDDAGPLFRPLHHNRGGGRAKALTPDAVYKIVRGYSSALGFEIGAHALRATAATNALDHQADIAKVQEWLGHANIATTRIYDRRKTRAEDSPTFKVAY